MNITVEVTEEHEDGSATITFEADKKAKEFLMGKGLIFVIMQALGKEEELYGSDTRSKS
jgi:hypothetical protein